jgi:hypothetical protein
MPKIENKTIVKHAKPICDALKARGDNWNADAMAAVCVKVVLEEMGASEQLGDEFKTDRAAVINIIKSFFTAPKNWQQSYLAVTEVDGKPLMPKVEKSEASAVAEFA